MQNKIDLNVVAESEEEHKIESYLEVLHNSQEVEEFLKRMRDEAEKRGVYKYRERVKNSRSAIRTYRINHKKLEEAHDYIGISFITNSEEEIYPIIEDLKKMLTNFELIDFVSEEMIYSPLVYIKWVPPLAFNIFAHEKLILNQMEVPIEIRVASKEAFFSEQAAYYSVQKNDTIKMPIEEKNKLRNIVQHITYKFGLLNIRNLNDLDRQKHKLELEEIIMNNRDFLKQSNDLCKDALLDLIQLIYKDAHNKEILEDEENMTNEETSYIDNNLKEIFEELLQKRKNDMVDRVCSAIEKLKIIPYEEIKNDYNKYEAV